MSKLIASLRILDNDGNTAANVDFYQQFIMVGASDPLLISQPKEPVMIGDLGLFFKVGESVFSQLREVLKAEDKRQEAKRVLKLLDDLANNKGS